MLVYRSLVDRCMLKQGFLKRIPFFRTKTNEIISKGKLHSLRKVIVCHDFKGHVRFTDEMEFIFIELRQYLL